MNASRRRTTRNTGSVQNRDCLPGVRCNCPREYALCMTVRRLGEIKVKSDQFTWDRGIVAVATAEQSELQLANQSLQIGQRSAGFEMESHITGKKVLFHLESEVKDAEGDILYWEFKPVSAGSPMVPAMTVMVFND